MSLSPEDTKIMESWSSQKGYSPGTLDRYEVYLYQYTTFHGKSLESLLDEATQDEEGGVRHSNRKVNQRILTYKNHLEGRGLAPHTVNGHLNALKSLYTWRYLWFPDVKRKRGDVCLTENYHPLFIRGWCSFLFFTLETFTPQ